VIIYLKVPRHGVILLFSWVALTLLVLFFRIKNSHNLVIQGIFPIPILASYLNALFEGACLLWDSV